MISIFLKVIIPVIIIFLIGFIFGKKFSPDQKSFSSVSIYILTPCLVFISLLESNEFFKISTLKIFTSVTILIIITYILVELISRIFRIKKELKTILLLTLILPNTGNYGMPVIEYAFGKEALPIASILLIIYIFFTNTLGIYIASNEKNDYKSAFKNVLKIPVFYAMLLAIILSFFKIKVPEQLLAPIRSIGYSAIPVNLLLVGINLSNVKIDRGVLKVVVISLIKLIVIPVAGFVILKIFGIEGMAFKVSITQIAMPSAIYSSILATHFEGNEKLASEVVLISLLMSMLTLPAVIYLLNFTLLP
ncbi:MAG: AEC family transporter [Brevinematia bacterium]